MEIKNEDNHIIIGDRNKIRDSIIGNKNDILSAIPSKKAPWYSKLIWKIITPVTVAVIAAIIIWLLNLT